MLSRSSRPKCSWGVDKIKLRNVRELVCDHILENCGFGHSWTFAINRNRNVLVNYRNLAKNNAIIIWLGRRQTSTLIN